MKKKIIYTAIVIVFVVVLAAVVSNNSEYSLNLDPTQITKIALAQSGTAVDVLAKDDICKIVDNFNGLQLKADKQFSTGYVFKVAFYDNDDILADLTINSESRLYGREVVGGTIDLQLLTSIFEKYTQG